MKSTSLPSRIAAALFFCAAFSPVVVLAQTPRVFTSYFFFGDSLSDDGNLFALTAGTQPPSPYFNGRFSNGPVFPEYLRSGLQPAVTAAASVNKNLDFAFGGATATAGSPVPSLSVQLGLMQQRGIAPTRGDLFTLLAGANDLLNTIGEPTTQTPAAVTATATAAASSVSGSVQTLLGAGAKNILVLNLPNIAHTPRFVTGSGAPAAPLAQIGSQAFNTELRSRLAGLTVPADARLTVFDLGAMFETLLSNPARFGFNVTNQEYLGQLLAGQTPGNIDGYMFWDGIHPTTRTHAIIAQALNEALNPELVLATAAPQATALFALDETHAATFDEHLDRLHQDHAGTHPLNGWFNYSYKSGARAGDSAPWEPSFNYHADAYTAGGDWSLSPQIVLGVGVSSSLLKSRAGGVGSFDARDESITVYSSWHNATWYADGSVDHGSAKLRNIRRFTALAGLPTRGETSATHSRASLRAGGRFSTDDNFHVEPWLGLRYDHVSLDGYKESGVPSLNFAFADSSAKSTDGLAGVNLDWTPTAASALPLSWGFSAVYRHDFVRGSRTLRGALADTVATPATVLVHDGDGDDLTLNPRVSGNIHGTWMWSAGYAFDTRASGKSGNLYSVSVQTGF